MAPPVLLTIFKFIYLQVYYLKSGEVTSLYLMECRLDVYIKMHIGVRAILGQGGAVNHLPKKFLQVAQIFTKQSKRNEGHTMQQHRPYWHMKVPRYSFSGSIPQV